MVDVFESARSINFEIFAFFFLSRNTTLVFFKPTKKVILNYLIDLKFCFSKNRSSHKLMHDGLKEIFKQKKIIFV